MKKILVPTDFSECAGYAVDLAVNLASQMDGEVIFLHLTTVPVDWKNMPDQDKLYPDVTERVRKVKADLNAMKERVEKNGQKARCAVRYQEGYTTIINFIEEEGIDLVVMGSHGAGALKAFFVGSMTQKVARLSPVPVFVVKSKFDGEIKNILFPSDFSEDIMDEYMKVVEIAKALDAKLHLIFINTPFNFADTKSVRNKMGNYALHAPGEVESTQIYNSYEFEEGLKEFIEGKVDVDLVAMVTHGRKGFSRIYTGNMTENVLNTLNKTVLSIRINPED